MRPINLIPPEDRRGERAPLRQGPLAYVVVTVLILSFGASYLMVSTSNSISDRKAEIVGLEEQLEATRARAEALQSFTQFSTMEAARTTTISSLATSRFDWERVMRELALVIPTDVTLSGLSASTGTDTGGEEDGGAATASTEASSGPTLTMSGCAASHRSVATFLAALRDIDGVTRVGLSSTSKGEAEASGASIGSGNSEGCSDPERPTFEVLVAFDDAVTALPPESLLEAPPTTPSEPDAPAESATAPTSGAPTE